ncbi:hypothetical protein MUN78_04525 [Leucobacter allii]|uniref:Antitoxin n=1 Tax=Leucobacter allii TaxID=2932247 RepID=A0ABY4FPC1_9MICO|nr:hypothetical protein [Leucobacter allii]UOQ58117.1 hypothetical protein MUN78_04525 [Leucobacter allii]
MAIRDTIIIDIATVEVSDELRVELRQQKKLTEYTAQQARDLAGELLIAADEADAAIDADMAARGMRLTHGVIVTDEGEVVL